VLCESGDSLNRSLREAVEAVGRRRQDLAFEVHTCSSFDVPLVLLAQEIERVSQQVEGLVLVAREDQAIIRAARAVKRRGTPVACLATDLPRSCRHGFVGSDERSAGAAAAGLMGDLLGHKGGRILFVACGDYHAAKDREEGFRSALAEAFPQLTIDHRVDVRNDPDLARAALRAYVSRRGPPKGIYSIAGGNTGIGQALGELGLARGIVFVGHELNANSRALLASGAMHYLIARDQEQEVMLSVAMLEAILDGHPYQERDERQVRILSKHPCG
jgi:LacI family transcriptional regulator